MDLRACPAMQCASGSGAATPGHRFQKTVQPLFILVLARHACNPASMAEKKRFAERWLAIALILLAVTGVASFSYGVFLADNSNQREAADAAHYYQRNADKQIASHCPRITGAVRTECVNQTRDAARDKQREEYALGAQKLSAHWTRLMGIAAFVGVLLSAVGIYLIFKTFEETREQSDGFNRSVEHAARSAKAMEAVAKSMARTAKMITETVKINKQISDVQKRVFSMQNRAYITVKVGSAHFQDQQDEIYFAAWPKMFNIGSIPACNVRAAVKVGILPVPLPPDFVLEVPDFADTKGNMIPQNDDRRMFGLMREYIPDDDVAQVMSGSGRAFYAWGRVLYDDEFGQGRTTDFCFSHYWLPREGGGFNIEGFYIAGRNTAI